MKQNSPKCGSGMLARGLASQRNGWDKRIKDWAKNLKLVLHISFNFYPKSKYQIKDGFIF